MRLLLRGFTAPSSGEHISLADLDIESTNPVSRLQGAKQQLGELGRIAVSCILALHGLVDDVVWRTQYRLLWPTVERTARPLSFPTLILRLFRRNNPSSLLIIKSTVQLVTTLYGLN